MPKCRGILLKISSSYIPVNHNPDGIDNIILCILLTLYFSPTCCSDSIHALKSLKLEALILPESCFDLKTDQ